jgi:hypothetical protein
MKTSAPLANLITLGALDFSSLRDFYRNVGWPQIIDDGQFAACELRGIVLALFPINQLARDGNAEPEVGTGGIRFTIAKWSTPPTRSTGSQSRCAKPGPRDQGASRRGVLHRPFGLSLRPGGQLLRDRLGRRAGQPSPGGQPTAPPGA